VSVFYLFTNNWRVAGRCWGRVVLHTQPADPRLSALERPAAFAPRGKSGELRAAAEAVGVDVSATDADIDELSAGARAASTVYPPAIQPWTPNCLTEGEKVTCVWCVSRWSSLELCGW